MSCDPLFAQNEVKSVNEIKQRLDSIISVGSNEKYEYYYNNLGQNTSYIHYVWNNTNMKYIVDIKIDFTYDLNGNCISKMPYTWDKTKAQWYNDQKYTYSFDDKNQILTSNYFLWNSSVNKWELAQKNDYENTYISDNKLSAVIKYTNTVSSTIIVKEKFEYTYSNVGLTSVKIYPWDSGTRNYDSPFKYDFTFDPQSNLTSIKRSYMGQLNGGGTGWISGSVIADYQYNNNFTANQILTPLNFIISDIVLPTDFSVAHMIVNLKKPVEVNLRYYYSPMEITGIDDIIAIKARIFPNPATDFLNIQWNGNQSSLNFELIDISGKKVFAGNVENNSKLPINGYPEGLYLVKISDNNKTLKTEKVYFKQN